MEVAYESKKYCGNKFVAIMKTAIMVDVVTIVNKSVNIKL